MKYLDLLLVPVFAMFFCSSRIRRYALYALAASLATTVLLSLGLAAGIFARPGFLIEDNLNFVPFKFTLTHTILVSYGAFLFIQLASQPVSSIARWLWITLAGLAILNVFIVVPGRTGFIILGALLLYCSHEWWGWNGIIRMLAILAFFSAIAFSTSSSFNDRVYSAFHEYLSWTPEKSANTTDSVGTRMEFYRNTLAIVRDNPIFGVGTGGFPEAYARQVNGMHRPVTRNPHNEYLLITVQIGLAGLCFLIYLFWQQWRLAPRLRVPMERHLARGLVIMITIGCLFNSLLLDHAEGLFFAWLTALLFSDLEAGLNRATAINA